MEVNRIYQMDCIEGMQSLEDNSIDLIIADPPYNIKKAEWDKWKNQDDYLSWMKSWMLETQRILKDNGSFYWFHNQMSTINRLMIFLENKTDFIFKQMVIWDKWHNRIRKRNNLQGAFYKIVHNPNLRNYPKMAEYILFYTFQDETGLETIMENNIKPLHPFAKYLRDEFKKAGVTRKEIAELFPSKTGGLTGCVSNWLNGDNVITKEQYHKIKDYLGGDYLRMEYEDLRYTFNQCSNDTSVWQYPIPNISEREDHPSQKPKELIRNIILHSSNPNDIVLDPFMGSGTTAKVAKELNRNYIGFELEEKYIDIANERLKSIQKVLV